MSKAIWNVYLVTCETNGQQYIGITEKPVAARWASHVVAAYGKPSKSFHSQRTIIAAAIREHGPETFRVEHVLCCWSRCDAERYEGQLVTAHDCQYPRGLNATPSGNSRGHIHTHESRGKISAAKRAQWDALSPDERNTLAGSMGANVKRWWAGLNHTEREAKISRLKAWSNSPENRQRIAIIGKTRVVKDHAFEEARRAGVRAATRAGRMGPKSRKTIRDRRQPDML